MTLPFLWVLWDLWTGKVDPLRAVSPSNFYDLQGRAMLGGHFDLPPGSIGIEAFLHAGRTYTYFGLFPSLLRLPVLAVTHAYDGRLTAPSILAAWLVACVSACLLYWRVRVVVRGAAPMGWAEAVAAGASLAALTGGSVLVYLAATPKVSHEDLAWSVALTIACLFALLGVLERPSWGRLAAAAVLMVAAVLDRGPTGYACALGALLAGGRLFLRPASPEQRRWALPTACIGIGALVVSGVVGWLKLGQPFGLSEADQVWTHLNAHRRAYLAANGGNAFGLRFLPSTLRAYLDPLGIHLQGAFPYVTLPTAPPVAVGSVILDNTYPTFGIPASMPLWTAGAVWGVITAFRPRPVGSVALVRVLLVAAASAMAGILLFGYIADRYLGDAVPFLALAGAVGLCDLWRRLDAGRRTVRRAAVVGLCLLASFEVWANVGAALTPSGLWTPTQSLAFVQRQLALDPAATQRLVRVGDRLPYFAPAGTIYAMADCSGVYVSTGFSYATVPGQQLQHETWDPVLQGPGIVHVAEVRFTRPVRSGDAPVTVLTWGRTSVQLVPSGPGTVRTVVVDPGGPPGEWPPTTTAPQPVEAGRTYQIEVITDPNLQSITAGGLGGGVVHFLAGTGPAVVPVTPDGAAGAASVRDVTPPAPSMALCRQLVAGAGRPSR